MALGVARQERHFLPMILVMSLGVQALNVAGIYFIAKGLPGIVPSFSEHMVIVPLAVLASSAPLPGGLGAVEMALDYLYVAVGPEGVYAGQGFVIALAYLLIRLSIAGVGVIYYLAGKHDIDEALHKLEEKQSDDSATNNLAADHSRRADDDQLAAASGELSLPAWRARAGPLPAPERGR